MNSTVYLFGKLETTYVFYPRDYAHTILTHFATLATTKTQLIVHREERIIYYGYIRFLDDSTPQDKHYIGLCIGLNNALVTDLPALVNIFENTFATLVVQGEIIGIDDNGDIVPLVGGLAGKRDEIDEVTAQLRASLERLSSSTQPLPPQKYGVARNGTRTLPITSDNDRLLDATTTYSYTCITKSSSCDSPMLDRYKTQVIRLNKEIDQWQEKYNAVKKTKITEIVQTIVGVIVVIIIAFLLFLAGRGVYNYCTNKVHKELEEATTALAHEQQTTKEQKAQISQLKDKVWSIESDLRDNKSELQNCKSELSTLRPLKYYLPLIIDDVQIANVYYGGNIETDYGNTIYSSTTMYLRPKLTYRGIDANKRITLKIKLYKPDGTLSTGTSSPAGYTTSDEFIVYSGSGNEHTCLGWGNEKKGNWGKGTYRFEFWYEGVCLKTKTFTIY